MMVEGTAAASASSESAQDVRIIDSTLVVSVLCELALQSKTLNKECGGEKGDFNKTR